MRFHSLRVALQAILIGLAVPVYAGTDYYSTGPGQGAADGLCDVWQQLYDGWGLTPGGDEDNDGCTNQVEAIAGTDPRKAGDCHKVGNMIVTSTQVIFTFTAEKGKKYQVRDSDSPAGPWTLVVGSTKVSTQDHADDTITIAKAGGNQKFYKLEVLDNDGDTDGVSDWAEYKTNTDPGLGTSPGNASGGAASDGETLHSLLSLSATVDSGNENAYEKEGTKASITVSRGYGTMPLSLPVSQLADAEADPTKGEASAGDYSLRRSTDNSLISGTLNIPNGVANLNVLVDPVNDTTPSAGHEVPENLKIKLSLPGAAAFAGAPTGQVMINDADPGILDNRQLFVAYLGREAGVTSTATGLATALVEGNNDVAYINLTFSNLSSPQNTAYLRVGTDLEVINLGIGQVTDANWPVRAAQTKITDQAMLTALYAGELYISVTTSDYPSGELKGYFNKATGSTTFNPANPDLVAPTFGSAEWDTTGSDAIERDIYRFLQQCTYGPNTTLYNEVRAEVDAVMGGGGSYLDGLESWLDKQIDIGQTPNPSLRTLVLSADNEEFLLRGSRPLNSGNDPQFGGVSYSVTYDAYGNPTVNTTSNGTYNNNHPFHNNRRREMWTLALQSKAQVRQRMAQALSEITVISELDQTVQSKHYGAASYWDMLADNAFGKYRTILDNVTHHPMMGIYLSHLRNRAAYVSSGVTISPDENYAREIMQLFSIGLVMRHPDGSLILDSGGLPIPTYDNEDITELAKVMTGLCAGARHATTSVQRFNGVVFASSSPRVSPTIEIQTVNFNSFGEGGGDSWWQAPWIYPMKIVGKMSGTVYHDFSAKTLLHTYNGGTAVPAQNVSSVSDATSHGMAEADLTIAHNLLAGNPASGTYDGHTNTPVNISRWLIQRLTSSNPSAGYIYRVSEVYRNTNGNLGAVFKAILLDYEARSLQLADNSVGSGRMKEPLVHFMALLRAMNAFTGIPLTSLRDMPMPFTNTETPYNSTYPQSEVDKFVSNASRFRFGDYTSVLGQSPLRAPSVFNWFLPDYVVPGPMAEAGLVAPEFQIATETNAVNRVNRLWTFTWSNIVGQATFPGVGVDSVTQIVNNAGPQVKISDQALGTTSASSFQDQRTFTFTTSNWNVPKSFTLAAVDDRRPEGPHTTTVAHSVSSTDSNYDDVILPSLTVNINDNESGGTAGVIITESGGYTMPVEGGATDSYTVQLATAPTTDVVITPQPHFTGVNGGTDVTVSPASLTFDSGNWNFPQTVTVTAVNDTSNEGPEANQIGHYITTTDATYMNVSAPTVYAIVADNESNGSSTVSLTQTQNSTLVIEGGATDTYFYALRRNPSSGNVTVTINGGTQVTPSPTSLTFTTSNWNIPQFVTVTAVDDSAVEGNHSQVISHVANGGNYSNVTTNITATIGDNDGGGITLAETGGNTTVTEGSLNSTNEDSYTVVLNSQPTADVTLTLTPQRHVTAMTNYAKAMGYYTGDMSSGDLNKDNVILDYSEVIGIYNAVFAASPGISGGSPSNAQKNAAHFAATVAVIDKLDLLLSAGELRARWPSLTLADLTTTSIVNPRKTIVNGVYNAYSITRNNTDSSYAAEVRDRCRIAAYLVCLSPPSIMSK